MRKRTQDNTAEKDADQPSGALEPHGPMARGRWEGKHRGQCATANEAMLQLAFRNLNNRNLAHFHPIASWG